MAMYHQIQYKIAAKDVLPAIHPKGAGCPLCGSQGANHGGHNAYSCGFVGEALYGWVTVEQPCRVYNQTRMDRPANWAENEKKVKRFLGNSDIFRQPDFMDFGTRRPWILKIVDPPYGARDMAEAVSRGLVSKETLKEWSNDSDEQFASSIVTKLNPCGEVQRTSPTDIVKISQKMEKTVMTEQVRQNWRESMEKWIMANKEEVPAIETKKAAHPCNCDRQTLLIHGCKCGGV